jgi:hypothetical protein
MRLSFDPQILDLGHECIERGFDIAHSMHAIDVTEPGDLAGSG